VSDRSDVGRVESQTPAAFAQAPPKGVVRSFDEMNTGQMVFELQKTVGEVGASIAALTRTVEIGFSRIEKIEHSTGEIKDSLRLLIPKIEDLVGFIKHRAPGLADKTSLVKMQAELKAEIILRPTRRQAILDIAWVVALITAAATFGSKFAH
jgi:hypothetical protein